MTPIFGSIREQNGSVSAKDLEDLIPGSEDIDQASIAKLLAYNDAVVVFMGAGDIEKYEDDYKARLKERG